MGGGGVHIPCWISQFTYYVNKHRSACKNGVLSEFKNFWTEPMQLTNKVSSNRTKGSPNPLPEKPKRTEKQEGRKTTQQRRCVFWRGIRVWEGENRWKAPLSETEAVCVDIKFLCMHLSAGWLKAHGVSQCKAYISFKCNIQIQKVTGEPHLQDNPQ